METVTLKIDGMHCGGCVSAIENALRAVDGVESVAVVLDAGSATVGFNPGRIDSAALAKAVTGAGYTVREDADGPRPPPSGHCSGAGKGKPGCGCG